LVQGIFATIGYLIFGIEDWGMWGFFTGVFAFFPLVGTMLIWVPLTMSHYLSGHEAMAIGLGLYSLIVTGNVDYLARMVFMKKMLNVHPIITVLGVIAGLSMFGFMGLIFGPLLISYLLILIRIYNREFSRRTDHNSENQPG
jgi:predicted PurR-regulated permease PerM